MVKSEIVKIKFTKDNSLIESKLHEMGINPLRWAIVAVQEGELLISVSFEK